MSRKSVGMGRPTRPLCAGAAPMPWAAKRISRYRGPEFGAAAFRSAACTAHRDQARFRLPIRGVGPAGKREHLAQAPFGVANAGGGSARPAPRGVRPENFMQRVGSGHDFFAVSHGVRLGACG